MKKKVVKKKESAPEGVFNVEEQIILNRIEDIERRQLIVEERLVRYQEKLNLLLEKLIVFINDQKIRNSIPKGESLKKHRK